MAKTPLVARRYSVLRVVFRPATSDPMRWHSLVGTFVLPVVGFVSALMVATGLGDDVWAGLRVLAFLGVIVVALLLALAALFLVERERLRREYQVPLLYFVFAPKKLRRTMRSIFASAEAIGSSRAYQSGMLDNADLHGLVYAAAVSGVDWIRISAGRQHLGVGDHDGLCEDADKAVSAIESNLSAIDDDLKASAAAAERLSRRLGTPASGVVGPSPSSAPRVAPADLAIDRAARERAAAAAAAVERLRAAAHRSNARPLESGHRGSDVVAGVGAAFDEVETVTKRVLHGPEAPGSSSGVPSSALTADKEAGQTATPGEENRDRSPTAPVRKVANRIARAAKRRL